MLFKAILFLKAYIKNNQKNWKFFQYKYDSYMCHENWAYHNTCADYKDCVCYKSYISHEDCI